MLQEHHSVQIQYTAFGKLTNQDKIYMLIIYVRNSPGATAEGKKKEHLECVEPQIEMRKNKNALAGIISLKATWKESISLSISPHIYP